MKSSRYMSFSLALVSCISVACAKKHHKSSAVDEANAADAQATAAPTAAETAQQGGAASTAASQAAAAQAAATLAAAQNSNTAASAGLPTVGCSTSGATKATVVGSVSNGVNPNYIEFSLSLIDCNGQPMAASGQTVFFDINASVTPLRTNPPTYIGTDSEKNGLSGTMTVDTGSDLFGRADTTYFHFQTDKPFDFSETGVSADLKIDLLGQKIYPISTTGLTANQVQVYLQIGTSVPFIGTAQLQ